MGYFIACLMKSSSDLSRFEERIEHEKMAAMTDLKNQIASISIEVAEKILERELSADNKQEDYLKNLIENANLN